MLKDQREEFKEFQNYVATNMVPIKDLVLGPKRLSQRERELEIARATSSFKNAADKKAVSFLADLKIDIRERQEAVERIDKLRVEQEGGCNFKWQDPETRAEINLCRIRRRQEEDGGPMGPLLYCQRFLL